MREEVEVSPQIPEGLKRPGFNAVIETLRVQVKNPPGEDLCIGSCYESLLDLVENNSEVRSFFEDIYRQRASITPAHYVNLIFRAVQFIKLHEEGNGDYQSYQTPQDWNPTLKLLSNSQNGQRLKELLLTKDTVTTKYQRYAGPRALLAALWPDQDLKVADFGCGANYGLRGIELSEPFEEIVDITPSEAFSTLLRKPINFVEGLAVDKQNPEDPEVKAWTIACSYYPSELGQMESTTKFERRLRERSRRVDFLNGDLLKPTTLDMMPKEHFHAVILSTVLYQFTPDARRSVIEAARKVIRADGVIIVQDFAQKDPDDSCEIIFGEPWFNNYGYRTMLLRKGSNLVYEIFQWPDGRCHAVRAGQDFDIVRGNIVQKK